MNLSEKKATFAAFSLLQNQMWRFLLLQLLKMSYFSAIVIYREENKQK